MIEDIDLHAWQSDGHRLTLRLELFTERGGRKWGQLVVRVECPEGSVCHRWAEAHNSSYLCMIQTDIEATGTHDFIDGQIDASGLPGDWSAPFPMLIEWKDEGEDGITWRPVTLRSPDDVTVTFPPDEAAALESLTPASFLQGAVNALFAETVKRAANRIKEARGQ